MELIKKSFSSGDIKKQKESKKPKKAQSVEGIGSSRKINKERCKKIVLKYEHMINVEIKVLGEFEHLKALLGALIDKYRLCIPAVDRILAKEKGTLHTSIKSFQVELWILALCPENRIKNFTASMDQFKNKKFTEADLDSQETSIILTYPDVENGIYRRISMLGDITYRKELDECMGFYQKIKTIFMSL
uniref:Uncharacterized protein n=1 Tax=viral metagenome TaxID=1070528 RepID=A0A6C0C7I8_9ZZZZ